MTLDTLGLTYDYHQCALVWLPRNNTKGVCISLESVEGVNSRQKFVTDDGRTQIERRSFRQSQFKLELDCDPFRVASEGLPVWIWRLQKLLKDKWFPKSPRDGIPACTYHHKARLYPETRSAVSRNALNVERANQEDRNNKHSSCLSTQNPMNMNQKRDDYRRQNSMRSSPNVDSTTDAHSNPLPKKESRPLTMTYQKSSKSDSLFYFLFRSID